MRIGMGMAVFSDMWRTHYDHPQPWSTGFPPLTLTTMFTQSVAQHGSRPLTDFMGARLTYAEIAKRAGRFAHGLRASGLATGDRVGLFLPNVPDYLVAYYGALMAGAIVTNMSPLYTVDELSHQITDSGARVIVTVDVPQLMATASALLERGSVDLLIVGSVASSLPLAKRLAYQLFKRGDIAPLPDDPRAVTIQSIEDRGDGAHDLPTIQPSDVALLQYTGGTTGLPKGAMLTHGALSANARQVHAIDPHQGEPDRIIGVLPFFHVFANTAVLNRTIVSGGLIAMLPRFEAKACLKLIGRVRATSLPGVPTMFQALLDCPDIAQTDFSSLRACISGGAPLAQSLKDKFETVTRSSVVEGYGLTESAGVVSCNPYGKPGKPGTIGQPLSETEVRLLDRENPARDAAPGEPGELAFRGPQAMSGYWQRPEADADAFINGWVRTGDVATIDDNGYIRIVDRLKDMIAVGGFKVFPSQIEAALYRHPAIKEAIVIGIPHPYQGETPKAFVTLNAGAVADDQGLIDWLNPQLGKHERVAAVEIRDALPKTLVGKLSRKELVAEERAKAAA
jgi:long-chain acyl-CoA synthetase